MYFKIKKGSTRIVFLTRHLAIKIPTLNNYKGFLAGLLANIQETEFGTRGIIKELTPVLYGNKYGLVTVMERVRPVKHKGLFLVELKLLEVSPKIISSSFIIKDSGPENFGYDNSNKLVKLDYGHTVL